jgi:hypothetical protein
MKHLSERLTYANVVATLALFLVLAGGTAFAATNLAQNSVGTAQIKNNAVTTSKLKAGAVTGAKIATGTLGTVPSATKAANAQTVGGQSAAQITAAAAPRCPAGTVLAAGLCFETQPRTPTTLVGAMEICGRAGRVLPSESEFVSYAIENLSTASGWEWVGQVVNNAKEFPAGALMQAATWGVVGFTQAPADASNSFRCAVAPS